jgi:hypothetical protein
MFEEAQGGEKNIPCRKIEIRRTNSFLARILIPYIEFLWISNPTCYQCPEGLP